MTPPLDAAPWDDDPLVEGQATTPEPSASAAPWDADPIIAPRRGTMAGSAQPIPEFQDAPETPEPAARTYDEMNPLERVPGQLRAGVHGLAASTTTPTAVATARQLRQLDRIDRGEDPDETPTGIITSYRIAQGPQRQRIRQTLERQFGSNVEYILRQQAEAAAQPANPRNAEVRRLVNEGRYGDAWRVFASDPAGMIQQATVSSLPASAAMMAPGVGAASLGAGRVATGLTTYAASFGTELGSQQLEAMTEALQRAGVNTADPQAVGGWIRANPDAMRSMTQAALRGANGPALFDALTLGFGRGVVPGRGVLPNTGRVATNFAAETLGEPAGAALGQVMAHGEVNDPGSLVDEFLGGVGQVGPTTAVGTMQEAREAAAAGARSPAAPPVPPVSPIPGPVVSPPPAAPPPLEAATPVAPEPPPPVSSPAVGEPPAPAPDPSAPLSPVAGGAPPSAGLAAEPVPPAEGAAAPGISPAAPPQAGPAVAPGSEVSSGAPEVAPPNSPPVPLPPPVLVNPTQGLRDLLNDPRPMAEIEQERAAQREAGIQAMREALPPGWSVVDEGGTISVLDPNGEWTAQSPTPATDIEALRAETGRRDAEGVQSGLYPDPVSRTASSAPFGSPEQASAAGQLSGRARAEAALTQAEAATDVATQRATNVHSTAEQNVRVSKLEEHAPQVPGPSRQELRRLRSKRDRGLSRVADELSGVPADDGSQANASAYPRQDRRDEGLQPEQLPVGNASAAGAEPEVLSPDQRAREDDDRRGVGARTEDTPADALSARQERMEPRKARRGTAGGAQKGRGDADRERPDAHRLPVGAPHGATSANDQGENAARLDGGEADLASGESADEVARPGLAEMIRDITEARNIAFTPAEMAEAVRLAEDGASPHKAIEMVAVASAVTAVKNTAARNVSAEEKGDAGPETHGDGEDASQPGRQPTGAVEPAAPEPAPDRAQPSDGGPHADGTGRSNEPETGSPDTSAAPDRVETQPEAPSLHEPRVVGEAMRVTTPTGSISIEVRPEIVELASLEEATGDLQPRNRADRAASDAQVSQIAATLDPARLMLTPESDRGAPIVGPDDIVESGNGRVAAMRLAAVQHPDAWKRYTDGIAAAGYDTSGFEQPVLIRRRVTELSPAERRQFVVDSNRDDKMAMSPAEQAEADAKAITDAMLGLYEPDVQGGIRAAQNRKFVKAFLSAAVSPGEMNAVVDEDGSVSQAGERRIMAALLFRAYEDRNLLSRALESTDDDSRAITSGMVDAAGAWAAMRAQIQQGEVRAEFDITKELARAADLIRRARETGQSPAAMISTPDMLNPVSPIEAAAVRMLTNEGQQKAASRTAITRRLREYSAEARTQTTDADLVGGRATITPEQALDRAMSDGQSMLLSTPEQLPTVAELSGKEIQGDDIRARRQAAERMLRQWQGQSFESDALGAPIRITRRGIRKTINGAGDRILDGVPAIPNILRLGVRVGTAENTHVDDPMTRAFHYLQAVVDVGGKLRVYRVVVREARDGHLYYDLEQPEGAIGEPSDPRSSLQVSMLGRPEDQAALPEQTRQVEGRPSESRFNLVEVSPEGKISSPVGWDVAETTTSDDITPEGAAALRDILQTIAGREAALEMTQRLGAVNKGEMPDAVAWGPLVRMAYMVGQERAGWVIRHEGLHVLRNLGKITDAEWQILTEASAREGWKERFGIEGRYSATAARRAQQEEEAIVEAFAQWATGNAPAPSSAVERVFQKIRQFLVRLRNALKGRGFQDAESLFRKIEAGDLGRREGGGETRGPASVSKASQDMSRSGYGDADAFFASIPGDVARRGREKTEDFLHTLFGREKQNPQIHVEERAGARDLAAWERFLKTPERLFRRFPALSRLIESGMKAEQRMQTWLKSLTDDYEEIRRTLRRAKGDWAKVSDALVDADMEGVDYDDPAAIAAHLDAHELSPAERTATIATHQLLMKIGRVVDQHRRAMLPQVRARKAQVWARMKAILDGAKVDSAEYAKAYRRRAYLNGRIKAGEGDISKQAAERDEITKTLHELRLADPDVMARYDALREDYDALEARLAETSIRKRIKGYFPHKFYGSWRLYENTGKDDEGNDTLREITSNQGFYDSREQAIAAAKAYLAENPSANLEIKPRMVTFPAFLSGTPVSDASYRRLMARMEDEAGISGDAFRQAMKGIVRRRARRRVLTAAMKRTGADGYAGFEEDNRGENADKVLRTHINQIVRYVVMDRMKFQFVNETERLGLSPYRREALKREGRIGLHDALEGWWRDLNGSKQPFEEQIDRWLTKAGVPGSVTGAAAAGAAIGGLAAGPLGAGALATYLGWRMSHAQRKGGEFQTRTFTGGIVGDVAHLKLGMGINIGSAAVNLTQTLINTYPVLGARWTAEGTKRAAAAMWQQATTDKADWDGDARILQRLDIATDHRFTEEQALIRQHISTMKRISMFWFETAERMNRATAALGAYHRAIDAGRSPAQAIEEARRTLTDTQFQQGLANKPEMLRLQALRIPTQFWNFMFQQMAFAFKLGGQARQTGDYAPVIRFYAMIFLMAGMLGFPGMQLFDWLLEKVTGERPTLLLRRWAIEEAQRSKASGTAAQVLLRGLPALAGVDISSRIGMGKGFGPDQLSDFTGPFIGSLVRYAELARRDAPILERMGALSPAAEQTRQVAAAVRGDEERRSGMRRGAIEDRPTGTERAQAIMGFRPIGRSMEADVREHQSRLAERRRQGLDRYLSAIIQADERGEQDRIGDIAREARAAGVNLTQQQIVRAIRESRMTRAERDTRRAPREVRPEIYRLHQGVRDYRGAER